MMTNTTPLYLKITTDESGNIVVDKYHPPVEVEAGPKRKSPEDHSHRFAPQVLDVLAGRTKFADIPVKNEGDLKLIQTAVTCFAKREGGRVKTRTIDTAAGRAIQVKLRKPPQQQQTLALVHRAAAQ